MIKSSCEIFSMAVSVVLYSIKVDKKCYCYYKRQKPCRKKMPDLEGPA